MTFRFSLPRRRRSWVPAVVSLSLLGATSVPSAFAIQPTKKKARLLVEGVRGESFEVGPTLRTIDGASLDESAVGLQRLVQATSREWEIRWDDRSNRPHLIQGVGVPLLPGAGNALASDGAGLVDATGAARQPVLADVERLLRGFMAEYADILRVDAASLRLDPTRSAAVGNGRAWFVEFQQFHGGVPVEGAAVYFRVNNGNIVQFGADRVSDVRISARPALQREAAFRRLLARLGVERSEVSEIVDAGTLKIYPMLLAGEKPGHAFAGARGQGYRHTLGWQFVLRLKGDESTYKAVVDARNAELLHLADLTVYADATVSGGIYPVTNTDPEVVRPFPFTNVTNGGPKVTNVAGIYNYTGGTATATLNGQFIRISDACGAISLSNSTTGNLAFGTSGGTDCTTPGVGGAGNTHAARSGFYHLTNINRKAAGYLPGNAWLGSLLTANMNINNVCNAFWNGSTVNFYRSGGGCSNTGELAAVFLHEWGHGMDTNSGGAANEQGSGEAVGDTFAFLETKDSCIGQNFIPGVNCDNCTNCTGVRDVGDFDLDGPAVIAKPSNVTSNAGINCDAFACPYLSGGIFPYQGPMGYEGHCESYIASSANWDLAQSLVATHGTDAGWATMDSIWYESLTPSKSAYQLVSGGKCNPAAVVNGCAATNWYTVYLAVDDDDGNLANGTPNGCRIWDAFTAHGIACGARPACSGGCTPSAVANAGPDQTISSGQSVTIGTPGLSGHTYSWSPGGATTAQITVSPTVTTTYTVTATTTCNSASDSVTVTVGTGPGPQMAVYNANQKTPMCSVVGSSCDSGTLVNGRDGKGPEPNASNTYLAGCQDGTVGTYHLDESNDRLKVVAVDGGALRVGTQVRIEATVWAFINPANDRLDLFYASQNNPVWTFIGTITPPVSGPQTLTATYNLPTGAFQAVRAQFRYAPESTAMPCSVGGYSDRDDLIFAVSP